MDRRRLAKLFYDQARSFADLHGLTREDIAAAQFHASVRLAMGTSCPKAAADWIERRKTEYRTTIEALPDWFEL